MGKFSNEMIGYALRNAMDFGSTDAGKVLTKLFQHGLKKEEIKEIMPELQATVKKINAMLPDKMNELYKDYSKFVKEREEKEETHELPELENASGKMVFRLAPYPSGALHLGNAKTYLLNALYAEKYKAKTLLVMDDTIGSEEKQLAPEAYSLIEEAFKWLKLKYEKPVLYKSSRMKMYYEYAEKLIKKNYAYVCHCAQEQLRENRANGMECACRQFPADIQLKRWKEMFNSREGDAVLRIKTDMRHPNPAFRDRVLFKISEREHPKVGKKYKVWPTLEMSWAIDDHDLGITHILRGNDLRIETDMEKFIWDIFGWKHPVTIHTGMIKIEGMGAKISKSKAQKEVKSGEFTGWDDPRTWSMQSLSRRGIKAEAVREFVKEIGLNRQDIIVPIESLYAINRKMGDSEADRYSFVRDPIKLDIENKTGIKVAGVPVHPSKNEMRMVPVKELNISKEDYEKLEGKEVRLLHLFNIKLGRPCEVTSLENKDIPKIQWVSENVHTRILMPDGMWAEGIAESAIENLKPGQVIQFERVGFVRFDRIGRVDRKKYYEFWFGHK